MKRFFGLWIIIFLNVTLLGQISARSLSSDNSIVYKMYSGNRQPDIHKRDMTIQVGDSTKTDFEPVINMDLWKGECFFNLNLRNNLTPFSTEVIPQLSGITYHISDTGIVSYRTFQRADGNFEWEIILNKYPM